MRGERRRRRPARRAAAARSRGRRDRDRAATANAGSRAPRRARARSARARPASATKKPTASRRSSIAGGSVSGLASRSARSRAPAGVIVRSRVASSEPRRSPAERARQFEIGARRRRRFRDWRRRARRAGGDEAPAAASICVRFDIGQRQRRRRRSRRARRRRSRRGSRRRRIRKRACSAAAPSLASRAQRRDGNAHLGGEPCGRRARREQALRRDDLARLQPRDLGGEARVVRLARG